VEKAKNEKGQDGRDGNSVLPLMVGEFGCRFLDVIHGEGLVFVLCRRTSLTARAVQEKRGISQLPGLRARALACLPGDSMIALFCCLTSLMPDSQKTPHCPQGTRFDN